MILRLERTFKVESNYQKHRRSAVTDIHTPSVVRIADPANEVSTRWLSAKLFPTDCSPMEETTFTGCEQY